MRDSQTAMWREPNDYKGCPFAGAQAGKLSRQWMHQAPCTAPSHPRARRKKYSLPQDFVTAAELSQLHRT